MSRLWLYTLMGVDYDRPTDPEWMKKSQTFGEWYNQTRKLDRHSWFMHWTLKGEDGAAPRSMTTLKREAEAGLLGTLWGELELLGSADMLAGWKINTCIWPRLVNRSLSLKLALPTQLAWAKMEPTAKYPSNRFWDLHAVYTQGSFDRPQIELDEALEAWTGESVPPEWWLFDTTVNVNSYLAGNGAGNMELYGKRPPLTDLAAHADRIIGLMQEVAYRYE